MVHSLLKAERATLIVVVVFKLQIAVLNAEAKGRESERVKTEDGHWCICNV